MAFPLLYFNVLFIIVFMFMQPQAQKKNSEPGLIEAVGILDIILVPLIAIYASYSTSVPGVGIFVSLLILPLWVLFFVPVVLCMAYGIRTANFMKPVARKTRLVICSTTIIIRTVVGLYVFVGAVVAFS